MRDLASVLREFETEDRKKRLGEASSRRRLILIRNKNPKYKNLLTISNQSSDSIRFDLGKLPHTYVDKDDIEKAKKKGYVIKYVSEGYTDDPPTGGQYSDGGDIIEPAMHEAYNTYAGVARDLTEDGKAFTFGVAMADALYKKNEIVDDDSKLATVIDAIVKGVNKRMTGIKFKVKRVEDSQLGNLNQPMERRQK